MASGKTKSPPSQIYVRGFTYLGISGPMSKAPTIYGWHLILSPTFVIFSQMSPQKLLLQAVDIEAHPGPAPRCGVCRKSTTAKAVICCALPEVNLTKLWRHIQDDAKTMAPDQCHNCRSVPNSQILCCKCGNGFRLNHIRATCGVCDSTAHLECTALSRREMECLKQGL